MDAPTHVAAGCAAATLVALIPRGRREGANPFPSPRPGKVFLFFFLGFLIYPLLNLCPHRTFLWIERPGWKGAPFLWELLPAVAVFFLLSLVSPRSKRVYVAAAGLGSGIPYLATGLCDLGIVRKCGILSFLEGREWYSAGGKEPAVVLAALSQIAIVVVAFCLVFLLRQKVRGSRPRYPVGQQTFSRIARAEIARRLEKCGVAIFDLDDCVYPGTTTLTMVWRNTSRILLLMIKMGPVLALRVVVGGLLLGILKLGELFEITSSRHLVRILYWAAKGMPLSHLVQHVANLPVRTHLGVGEVTELLRKHMPCGLVSLALQPVLERFREKYGFTFVRGNPLLIEKRGEQEYLGGQPEKCILGGEDKRGVVQEAVAKYGATSLLVFGHHKEDLGMMQLAREKGGLAVGIRPEFEMEPYCDIISRRRDWREISVLLRDLLSR